ncbi:MAG: HD domain-containing protein [Lachnospiraceae bacterium]|nr:HD domain-containing protein [Lachnospiraceae bacterium]
MMLEEAVECNPGAWEMHSVHVANAARAVAGQCGGLDPDKAYVLGLLHDIGRRFGVSHLAHVYDGYHYLMALGYPEAAKVALSHSFNLQKLDDYIGKFDVAKEKQEEIAALLSGMTYDDYDYLIQLCDSIAKADGIVSLEERMNDVKGRYGYYPQEKWDRNIELKKYFEEKMGKELYQACLKS